MFLTVCNLILSPHPLGRSILDEARDQPIPGSFLKTLGTRLCHWSAFKTTTRHSRELGNIELDSSSSSSWASSWTSSWTSS